MKNSLLITVFALVLAGGLSSCSSYQLPVSADSVVVAQPHEVLSVPAAKLPHLFVKKDSLCIVTDKKIFCIKRDPTINYKNPYAGIYEIQEDSIKKSYCLKMNNHVYFTTFDDGVGHTGYLYVFDANRKRLIKDFDMKHNYLFSYYGIFIIDRKTNKIFSINPNIDDQKKVPIIASSMYSIKNNSFNLSKIIYGRFDHVEEDTTMIRFFRQSLADNAVHGLAFPNSKWK